MIHCLTGELLICDALSYTAVIDCGGVGYKVSVTGNAMTALQNAGVGNRVRVFTHMQVREDAVELFGMSDEEELRYFRMLISVSGVGPKAAMSILTSMTPHSLAVAIVSEDSKALSKAPGVGGKTAARIVLELHDKMAKEMGTAPAPTSSAKTASAANSASSGSIGDARDALTVLGYSRSEIMSALAKADQSLSTEELIKAALAILMKQ